MIKKMNIGLRFFILVLFYWDSNFLDRFWKNLQISKFMKIRRVRDGRADRQT